MLEYVTADQIKGFASPEEGRRILAKAATRRDKDTFFSHSSQDNALVPGAVLILENHGGSVYVDLGDDRLPSDPSAETAEVLRDTVRATRRFVLLVSSRSKNSIWIPWELGLADGQKGVSSVALFPAVDRVNETEWTEQEYLGLYSRIIWGDLQGYTKPLWMVYDHHKNTGITLREWLRGY